MAMLNASYQGYSVLTKMELPPLSKIVYGEKPKIYFQFAGQVISTKLLWNWEQLYVYPHHRYVNNVH